MPGLHFRRFFESLISTTLLTPRAPSFFRRLRLVAGAVALCVAAGCAPPERAPAPEAPAPIARPLAPEAGPLAPLAFPSFRLREWTVEDGLPGPIRQVAQSADGYLWLATRYGLFRFDGVRFTPFTTETVPTFASHDFGSVYASGGDLWVSTLGQDTYRLRDGAWTAFDASPIVGVEGWVQGFAEDAEGTLWLASAGERVGRFESGAWVPVEQRIRDVWTPFVADSRGGLWTYLPPEAEPDQPVAALKNGVVARWNGQRFVPPGDSRQIIGFEATTRGPLFHLPTQTTDARGRRRIDVTDGLGERLGWFWQGAVPLAARLVDRRGRIWLEPTSSEDEGILIVVRDGDEIARFEPEGATYIEEVFEDRQGVVWVLSPATGLVEITESPFHPFTEDDGATAPSVRASLGASGEVLVSGYRYASPTSVFTVRGTQTEKTAYPLAPEASGVVSNPLALAGSVVENGAGGRFGIFENTLSRLENGRAIPLSGAIPTLDWWSGVFPDPTAPEALWLSDVAAGDVRPEVFARLTRYDAGLDRVTGSTDLPGAALAVHRARDGGFWVATNNGLGTLGENGQFQPLAALEGVAVQALVEGTDGAIWAVTQSHGLARIRGGEVEVLGPERGIPTDLSHGLLDDEGALWLTHRRSLLRLLLADAERALDSPEARLDIVTLLPSTGHLGASDGIHSAAKAPDGSLWIPSNLGVTRVDATLYARQVETPPTVVVEALRTENGDTFAPEAPLPLGARTLAIEYTATDLLAPDLVRFQTRLVGHRDAWSEASGVREVTYGGLAPGTYTFEVRAQSGGGAWSEPATATFSVAPRVWETWWFGLLALVALIGLLLLGVRARVRTLTERRDTLERIVDERTEQLQTEKETVAQQAIRLAALNDAKTEFFTNVSHEFRTPLSLTIGPLEDLEGGTHGPLAPEAQKSVDLALRNSRRLLRLTNQLLDAARLEAGEMDLSAAPLDLAALVRAVALSFTPLAERRRVDFEVQTPEAALEVWADREHLETVLANLLSNAFKFTPEAGRVAVEVRMASGSASEAEVCVRDSGPGIEADDLPRVFERFYRVDETASEHVGSGIGLSLAKDLTELHSGRLSVESVVGIGSSFGVHLPTGRAHLREDQIAAPEAAPATRPEASGENPELDTASARGDGQDAPAVLASPKAAPPPPLGEVPAPAGGGGMSQLTSIPPEASGEDATSGDDRTTVLIADDNADIRAYVRSHLHARYRVLEATDGQDALTLARAETPDLIVSDRMMPQLDGVGLVRALKADRETDFIPVILLTAKADEADIRMGLDAGADDYVVKPFNVRTLLARIDNLIASRQWLRDRFSQAAPKAPSPPPEAGATGSASGAAFLARARGVICERLSDDSLSIEDVAAALGASRSTLHRRLRETSGETPTAFLRSVRLERAAELLAENAGSVSEVAYAVGFKSASHFSRAFRARFGIPPSAYAPVAGVT